MTHTIDKTVELFALFEVIKSELTTDQDKIKALKEIVKYYDKLQTKSRKYPSLEMIIAGNIKTSGEVEFVAYGLILEIISKGDFQDKFLPEKEAALDYFRRLIKSNSLIWNNWKKNNSDICFDFSDFLFNANFDAQDLIKINLSETNLKQAVFHNLNLTGANLAKADLSSADLTKVDLSGANLTRANLSGANLSGANLSESILSGTDLTKANLSKAILSGTDLIKANLSEANLSGAYLSGAYLSGANLSGVDLSTTVISNAKCVVKKKFNLLN